MYKALVVEAESEGTRRLLDVGEDTDTHKHVMTKKTLGNLYAELWPGTREKKNHQQLHCSRFAGNSSHISVVLQLPSLNIFESPLRPLPEVRREGTHYAFELS